MNKDLKGNKNYPSCFRQALEENVRNLGNKY